jgi:hypothetical protein
MKTGGALSPARRFAILILWESRSGSVQPFRLRNFAPRSDEGYGAFASRSTVPGGSAVFEATNALLAKIRVAAGARLGAAEQVELADGRAGAPDGRSLAFGELAAVGVRVTTAFGNDNRLTYTYGSAAARVAVDPGTGDVELLDCLVVEDVGRIVNPLTLHGQAIGGMVQGLGRRIPPSTSSMTQKGSCCLATSPTTLIPTATDFPKIRAIALENHRSPSNPLGVKGADEGAIIPIGGLMAKAVAMPILRRGASSIRRGTGQSQIGGLPIGVKLEGRVRIPSAIPSMPSAPSECSCMSPIPNKPSQRWPVCSDQAAAWQSMTSIGKPSSATPSTKRLRAKSPSLFATGSRTAGLVGVSPGFLGKSE